MISGSLTIGASHASDFVLPYAGTPLQGNHGTGRYTGTWSMVQGEAVPYKRQILLPHRDKHIDAFFECDSEPCVDFLASRLETLDASYEGETQLFKYNQMIADLVAAYGPHAAPFAGMLNTISTHSSFALLSYAYPIELLGVYDPQIGSAYLVWRDVESGQDLDLAIRQVYPLKYLIYRFPSVVNRSVFIPTQAICAHWWKYMKTKDPLFAFNALELKLFK